MSFSRMKGCADQGRLQHGNPGFGLRPSRRPHLTISHGVSIVGQGWVNFRRNLTDSIKYRHGSFSNLVTNLLMVEIDRKFAGVMSDMGIIRSNSDSTNSTSLTVSSEVSPTSIRTSSAQTDRLIERSSNTCWTTVTTRSFGEGL